MPPLMGKTWQPHTTARLAHQQATIEPDATFTPLDEEEGLASWFDADAWSDDPTDFTGSTRVVAEAWPDVPTELWSRGSVHMESVLTEYPYPRHVFTFSDVRRRRIVPHLLLDKMLPTAYDYEWMIIGRSYAEMFVRSKWATPGYVPHRVPVWAYGDDPRLLVRFCKVAKDRGWDRIVIAWVPRRDRNECQRVVEWAHRVAGAFPEVKLHYAFGNAFSQMFGTNFYSVDYAPSYVARYPSVTLPNGRICAVGQADKNLKWLHVLGFSAADLMSTDKRILFNFMSAQWAAEHWKSTEPLASTRGRDRLDPLGLLPLPPREKATRPQMMSRRKLLTARMNPADFDADSFPQFGPEADEPYAYAEPIKNAPLVPVKPRHPDNGDRVACNSCSLAPTCRVYREGSLCTVENSETAALVKMFGTRDAATVKDALRAVVGAQADRYERSRDAFREDESDIYDLKKSAHLTAMENSLLRNIEVLVKILDPDYRPNSLIPAINSPVTNIYNPQVLVANIVKELEARGVDRSQIDPAALLGALAQTDMKSIEQGVPR